MSDNEEYPFEMPDPSEMKSVAIGLITAALLARSSEITREKAIQQYTEDFTILTRDLKPLDWVALSSVLSNCGGALVTLFGKMNDVPAEEMMEIIAASISDGWPTESEE